MKRKFTFLIASAVMLLTMMATTGEMWGQTRDEVIVYTLDGTITGGSSGYATESEITQNEITWMVTGNTTMNPWRIGGKNLTNEDRPMYTTSTLSNDDITKVVVTNGTATATVNSMTLIVSANADFSNPTSTVSGSWAASSTTTFERPGGADWSDKYFKLVYNITAGSSNQYAQFIKAEFYKETGGSLQDSDLAITGDPVELEFDLYDNLTAQVVNYTTSSTGAITITPATSEYFTYVHNANEKTITVTPTAVTPSAQTVTIAQAADNTYNTGSATFTVSVANSTPQYTVTYKANGGTGDDIPVLYYEGADVTIAANTFVYAGHAFTKWNTMANGTGTDYDPEDVIENIGENIDLYAQWEESSEVVDVLDHDFVGVTTSTYTAWTDKTGTSGAVYAGQSAGGDNNSGNCIQLRSNNNNSGIIVTSTVGKAKKVVITWNSYCADTRTLNVYGKNSAYSTASDLYGNNAGTLIGTIVKGTSTVLNINDDYEFIGLRSASGAMYIDEIQITWEPDNDPAVATTVTINDANINNDCGNNNTDGGTFSAVVKDNEDQVINNAVVTWTSSNTNIATINESTGAVTLVAVGTTTITANYAGVANEYKPSSATYTLNVVDSYAPGGEHNPYTVAQARAAIDAASGATLYSKYATGIISEVVYYSESNHYITYNISDDGETTSNQLQAFHGKGIDGANFTSLDDLQVGDIVVVYGDLLLYNQTSTYEFAVDNQLVSLIRRSITVEPNTINVDAAEHDGTLTLTIENFTVSDVNNLGIQFYDGNGDELNGDDEPDWILFDDFELNNSVFSVDYTIGENNANNATARAAYVKVYTIEEEVYSNLVTITQEAPASIDYYLYSINGVEGDIIETTVGTVINLPSSVADIPEGYTWAGWTTTPDNITTNNILAPGSSYTITETVEFFAVYEKTEALVFNFSILPSDFNKTSYSANDGEHESIATATNSETMNVTWTSSNVMQSNDGNKIQWKKSAAGKIYNETTYGTITNVEVNETSTDALDVIIGATEQPTAAAEGGFFIVKDNGSNTGYATSITVTFQNSVTKYYTRVIPSGNVTPGANTTITGPTIISDGSVLDMGAFNLECNDPANLIIEDGGQVIVNNTGVQATFKKSVSHGASKDAANWYTISSPVNNVATASVTNLIQATPANYDLYYYDEATTTWFNHKAAGHAVANMTNGKGYLYWNNTGAELSFPGELNSTSVNIGVTVTGEGDLAGFNLIGNPYSHNIYKGTGTAIPNTNLSTGFYTLSNAGAWTAGTDNTTVIKPGQGILVKATAAGTVTMTNTTANGAKRDNEFIQFIVANSQYEDVTYALFEKEEGLPKISHRNADIPMIYIPQDGQNYAIATMSDDTELFGLNVKAMTTGQYTLRFKAEGKYDYLHVIDRLTGEDVDMLLDGEYSFIASPKDNDARFIVTLRYNTNGNNADNDIFAYQSGDEIIVNGEGELQVFDVMGRLVAKRYVNGVETQNVASLQTGVYILKLNDKTQKIVVR